MNRKENFKITINAGTGPDGEKYKFVFEGPKGAPLGVVYDACFAALNNITKTINDHTHAVAPKKPDVDNKEIK